MSCDNRLHKAAYNGDIKEITNLLASGTYIDIRNNKGNTPLIPALIGPKGKSKKLKTVEFLIENGADVNSINNEGDSILHIVVKASFWQTISKKIVQVLVDYGAKRSVLNNNGQAPYQLAFEERNSKLGSLLLFHEVKKPLQCSTCIVENGKESAKSEELVTNYVSTRRSKNNYSSKKMVIGSKTTDGNAFPKTYLNPEILLAKRSDERAKETEERRFTTDIVSKQNENKSYKSDLSCEDGTKVTFSYKKEIIVKEKDSPSKNYDVPKCSKDSPYGADLRSKKESQESDVIIFNESNDGNIKKKVQNTVIVINGKKHNSKSKGEEEEIYVAETTPLQGSNQNGHFVESDNEEDKGEAKDPEDVDEEKIVELEDLDYVLQNETDKWLDGESHT